MVQVKLAIQALNALVVTVMAPATKHFEQFAEAICRITLNGHLQLRDSFLISARLWLVSVD